MRSRAGTRRGASELGGAGSKRIGLRYGAVGAVLAVVAALGPNIGHASPPAGTAATTLFPHDPEYAVGTNPAAVAIGDLTGNGVDDLVVANAGSNDVSVLMGDGSGAFVPAVNYPVGAHPVGVSIGTFNGHPDIVSADANANEVSVLLGNGSGSFAPAVDYPVGVSPSRVVVGDFNGDHRMDMAVGDFGSAEISVLLGDGAGGFGAATNFPVGNGPFSLAVGSFRHSSASDLAVTNFYDNTVSIMDGHGTGSFASASTYTVGANPISVAVGNFTGRGARDLAVANATSNDVSVLLGNGHGGFSAVHNFQADVSPFSVAVSDFDGDGSQDLVVANASSDDLSILLGDGKGNFSFAGDVPVGIDPLSVGVGDLNNDGAPDLAVANFDSNNVSVLLNQASANPGLTSRASHDETIGGSIGDSATLVGGFNPGGTITFAAYAPGDTTCGSPVFTSTSAVAGAGSYESKSFTPDQVGTYHWTAAYSGNFNNNSAVSACGSPGQSSEVEKATPELSGQASEGVLLGQSIDDAARLSGGYHPDGSVTFQVFGPNDPTCQSALFVSDVDVDGSHTYRSGTYIPTAAGTYRWSARYSGDANNESDVAGCSDHSQSVTVAKDSVGLTAAAAGGTVGHPLDDSVTLNGGSSPTGQITYNLYGAADTSCTTSLFTTTADVAGDGDYTGNGYSPTSAGTYRWTASYSGDGNNLGAAVHCGAASQEVTVAAAPSTGAAGSATTQSAGGTNPGRGATGGTTVGHVAAGQSGNGGANTKSAAGASQGAAVTSSTSSTKAKSKSGTSHGNVGSANAIAASGESSSYADTASSSDTSAPAATDPGSTTDSSLAAALPAASPSPSPLAAGGPSKPASSNGGFPAGLLWALLIALVLVVPAGGVLWSRRRKEPVA